jgi:hypothetical protein
MVGNPAHEIYRASAGAVGCATHRFVKSLSIQPARMANSDTKALTRYLGAVGLELGPDRLNDLLVLLAVIVVGVGGGLSLAVGMALQQPVRMPTAARVFIEPGQPQTTPLNDRAA